MNVVIIGGGQKFGRMIADKFINDGHNVFILSHKNYGDNEKHKHADFSNYNDVCKQFENLVTSIDTIDLLLYNTNKDFGPGLDNDYYNSADRKRIIDCWNQTMSIQTIIPHLLAVQALNKMNNKSKIVFMTTALAFRISRPYATQAAGYCGGKAAQVHLMYSLATHNNKKAIVYSISTHLDYENFDKLSNKIERIYKNLVNIDPNISGRIVKFLN